MTPDRILGIAGAFRSSEFLLSALELGVFTELGRGPRSLTQLQRALHIEARAAEAFLDALVALDLLRREGAGEDAIYVNTRESAQFLDRNSPGYIGTQLDTATERLAPLWRALVASVRTGETRITPV